MNPTIEINEQVSVVSTYKTDPKGKQCFFPIKMRYKHKEVTFTKIALKHPTSKGQRMVHVFDMYDGQNDYRLEFDAERLVWMLISMIDGLKGGAQHGTKD